MAPEEGGAPASDPLRGESASSEHLRHVLTSLAEQQEGTPTGRLLADVLAGRRSLSDLSGDPIFMDVTRSGVEQYRQHLASLDHDERRHLAEDADDLSE